MIRAKNGRLVEYALAGAPRITTEEFLSWGPVEDGLKYELLGGMVVVSPSPLVWHNRVVVYVVSELDRFVRCHDLGQANVDIDNVVDAKGHVVFRPDVCLVSKARVPELARGWLPGAADLVVEVTSESSRRDDLGRKRRLYEGASDVREYWVLDIVGDPMKAYLWHRRGGRFAGGMVRGEKLKSRLLKGFELDLKTVWSRALEGRE